MFRDYESAKTYTFGRPKSALLVLIIPKMLRHRVGRCSAGLGLRRGCGAVGLRGVGGRRGGVGGSRGGGGASGGGGRDPVTSHESRVDSAAAALAGAPRRPLL